MWNGDCGLRNQKLKTAQRIAVRSKLKVPAYTKAPAGRPACGNNWGRTFKIRFGDAFAAHHLSLMLD